MSQLKGLMVLSKTKYRRHISHRLCSSLSMSSIPVTVDKPKKFIVVTGGVISGIGKGVTASSIGVILKMMNLKPSAIKIDPYLNVDAGTMSPFEHGEVFVLDDGGETDLDLGNYERFMDVSLTNDSNLTTGKIYQAVIAKERQGHYLGKTVQIIPHITNEIIERIKNVSKKMVDKSNSEPDVVVIELGGTIGDIESMPFVEALRQLQLQCRREDFCLVHVSMVPIIGENGEQKTKPTQHSVKELRALGLVPDFIVCRSKTTVEKSSKDKISLFCNVSPSNVLSIHDVPNIYHVPLLMLEQRFHELLDHIVDIKFKKSWEELAYRIDRAADVATVALVGKYTNQFDSYHSVVSALKHACIATDQKLNLVMVESSYLEPDCLMNEPHLYNDAWAKIKSADGILVPGGFGIRGIEGKIQAIKYARENKKPFL
eukprot:gene12146-16263_t